MESFSILGFIAINQCTLKRGLFELKSVLVNIRLILDKVWHHGTVGNMPVVLRDTFVHTLVFLL